MASSGTGVVIGSHSLKAVQVRRKGGILKVTRVANLKFDSKMAEHPLDAKKVERIGGLLEEAGLKPGETMMGLTGRDLIIRYTHVPPVPDWRLAMLMKFEIDEVGEQSGGEVSADWVQLDLPESGSADNTVLVALAKNASLMPRINVLKRAGLRLHGACPNSVGMYHAFTSTAKIPEGEVTLLMHVGAENTDIAIQKDGRLLFARNVAGGGRLFTEAVANQFRVPYDRAEKMKLQKADVTPKSEARYEDSMSEKVSNAVLGVAGQFVSMVHSSVMFCKAQTKIKELVVDRVVLAGGGANLKGFRRYLETNLGIPVVTFDPSGALDLSGLPPEQAEIIENDPTGLTVALGLASLSTDPGGLSLEILPEEYKKRRRFMEREIFMIGAAGAAALLIFILFLTSSWDHAAARTEGAELSARQKLQRDKIRAYEQAMDDYERAERQWVELRDKCRVGPCLQRSLNLMRRIIRGQEFKEIHLTRVNTSVETRMIKPPKEEDDSAVMIEEEEEGTPVSFVKVDFRAEVQPLRDVRRVYSDFVAALKEASLEMTGVTAKASNLQGGRVFTFSLYFAPGDIRLPE